MIECPQNRDGLPFICSCTPYISRGISIVVTLSQDNQDSDLSAIPPVIGEGVWRSIVETEGLSPMQADVIAMLMQGLEDKQIGPALGIAFSTVRTHRDRAVSRLGLRDANRVEITVRVFSLAWERRWPTED